MNKIKKIRIATRGSELALWQANNIKDKLKSQFNDLEIEVHIIKTKGDKILDVALSKINDKGLFTKAIEDSLLEGKTDIAVHSLKDVPTELPKGLIISAVTEREDPRDVLISEKYESLKDLPKSAIVATGSLRRKSQLLNYRNDLIIEDIRGNLQTRFNTFQKNGYDGMLLAYAGIKRMNLTNFIAEIISPEIMLPAVGQGVIGIESREEDNDINTLLKSINDSKTEICIKAERSFLHFLQGGCQIPIGVFTKLENNNLHISGMIGSLDGQTVIKDSEIGNAENPEETGIRLAQKLIDKGGKVILDSIRI